jgi:iron complex transport system substrate-binding protein
MFVMSLLNGRALAAGRHTAANEIIHLAGAVNAIDGYDGYKPITDEAIVAAKPEVVLSIQRGKDSLNAEAIYHHPGFAMTPVAKNKAFISMDGLYLLGFGPRTAAAARDLSLKLYPTLAADGFAAAAPRADCRK